MTLVAAHLVEHVGQGQSDHPQVMLQVLPVARCSSLLSSRVRRHHRLLPAGIALQQRLQGPEPEGALLKPGAIEAMQFSGRRAQPLLLG